MKPFKLSPINYLRYDDSYLNLFTYQSEKNGGKERTETMEKCINHGLANLPAALQHCSTQKKRSSFPFGGQLWKKTKRCCLLQQGDANYLLQQLSNFHQSLFGQQQILTLNEKPQYSMLISKVPYPSKRGSFTFFF